MLRSKSKSVECRVDPAYLLAHAPILLSFRARIDKAYFLRRTSAAAHTSQVARLLKRDCDQCSGG